MYGKLFPVYSVFIVTDILPQDPYKKSVCICDHLGKQNFRNRAQNWLTTTGSSNNASGFRKNNFSLKKPHRKKPQGLICRVETESDGTRRSTGGEVKGKEANGVGSQHSCTVSEHGLSSITTADAHTSAASSRLN